MALPQYNVAELIANIKIRCSVPTSQLTFEDTDWAVMASNTLQDEVVPLIMTTREEFFVTYEDVVLPADGIVPIPSAAVGAKLRSVCWLQQSSPLQLYNLPRLDLDVVAGIANNALTVGTTVPGAFGGFFLQDNSIHVWPSTGIIGGNILRLYYFRRALQLAAPREYSQVVDITDTFIQLERVPASFEIGSIVNTVSSLPNFTITNSGATVVAVSTPTVEVDDPTGIEIGDYMSLEGYSAIPQVPVEAHAYLAQLTAVFALESLNDESGAKKASEKADRLRTNLLTMVSSRVDGSPKKIVAGNGGIRSAATFGGTMNGGWGVTR